MNTKTVQIPHIEIEDAIINTLIEKGIIREDEMVAGVDLGLNLNTDNMVEIDLEYFDDDQDDDPSDDPSPEDVGPPDGCSIDWLQKATRKSAHA